MDLVIRAAVVFFFIFFVTRVVGRRQLSDLEPFDLILLVVLGDLVQQGITQSDESVTGTLIVISTIALLSVAVSWASFRFRPLRIVTEGELEPMRNFTYIHAETLPGSDRTVRNKDNDYLIDRQRQKTQNYTGLPGNRVEDAAMTESMGPIYDRTQEHLGTTDVAIIFWRRMMLRLARNLEKGIEPAILSNPDLFRAVPLQTTAHDGDFGAVWAAHHNAYRATLAGVS